MQKTSFTAWTFCAIKILRPGRFKCLKERRSLNSLDGYSWNFDVRWARKDSETFGTYPGILLTFFNIAGQFSLIFSLKSQGIMHRSFFYFFFNEAYLSMSMLMFICVWVTEALRGKWGIFFSGDALNCFLSGQYDSWDYFFRNRRKKTKQNKKQLFFHTLHTWRKQILLKTVAPLSKCFYFFSHFHKQKNISPFY